jgi:hypothetical protein
MAENNEAITPVPGVENLTYQDAATLLNIQRLWLELVEWIRHFFHCALESRPDQTAIGNYLFISLPTEIAREFKKYYSEAESQRFLDIISRMIGTNWQLATAYKNKDKTAIDLSTDRLYQTADELAEFLAGINPYLEEAQLKEMLHEYVRLRIRDVVALLDGNYESEIQIYEEIEKIVVRLSNYTAMGIIAQRHAAKSSACYYSYFGRQA